MARAAAYSGALFQALLHSRPASSSFRLQAIKKQRFGGSGSAPSGIGGGGGSGSSGAVGGAPAAFTPSIGSQFNQGQRQNQQPTSIVQFNVSGDIIGDTAEGVMEKMRELIEENDVVLFSPDSRQALDLQRI